MILFLIIHLLLVIIVKIFCFLFNFWKVSQVIFFFFFLHYIRFYFSFVLTHCSNLLEVYLEHWQFFFFITLEHQSILCWKILLSIYSLVESCLAAIFCCHLQIFLILQTKPYPVITVFLMHCLCQGVPKLMSSAF